MGRFKISLVESAMLLMNDSVSLLPFLCWECIKEFSGRSTLGSECLSSDGLRVKKSFYTGETLP